MMNLHNQVISSLEEPQWFIDEYGIHNLMFRIDVHETHMNHTWNVSHLVHAHITPRPVYCDRGHFHLNIDGPFNFDDADRFPRYFMDLERAKQETIDFLRWRITQKRAKNV